MWFTAIWIVLGVLTIDTIVEIPFLAVLYIVSCILLLSLCYNVLEFRDIINYSFYKQFYKTFLTK